MNRRNEEELKTAREGCYTSRVKGWQLGALMCKAAPYLQGVSVCASVNTLAAIALDRYFAICHTLEIKINTGKCKVILFFIWLTALGVMVPWLVFFKHQAYTTSRQHLYVCYDHWPSVTVQRGYYVGVMFVCCYSLPLAMITVCYSLIGLKVWRRQGLGAHNSSTRLIQRSKVKVLKMLVVVCVLFCLSWLPLYVINFWRVVRPEMSLHNQHILNEIVVPLAQWLSNSSCCMNPIIYCFFSKKFRQGFRELVSCCGCNGDDKGGAGSRVRFQGSPDNATRITIIKNGTTFRGNAAIVSL
ncbi:hypothetical protein ACOMHN_027552 [Nucella lapillus]